MKEYDGFLVDENYNFYSKRTKKKLTPTLGTDGYMQVQYRKENNKSHHNRVHVILAHCFIPNPSNLKYVNHIDSNKLNNSLDNLEWCTNSYNVLHGWHSGNRSHQNRTKVYVSDKDGNFIGMFNSIRQCAKALNLDRHKIARVLKNELPENYLNYCFSYYDNRQETIESVA